MERIEHWIAGKAQTSYAPARLAVFDPANSQAYAECPQGDSRDVELAVSAAEQAFPAWAALKASERARWLNLLADAIERRIDDFIVCESRDTGKPMALVRDIEIPRAIANFRFFAATSMQSLDQAFHQEAGLNYTRHSPLGVVGVISPWNLPLYLLSWKLAPALASGNCVIAKPSEVTPMSAHLLAQTAAQIGFPAGVLNILQGSGAHIGAAIVAHPKIKAISFTGSTAVGQNIAQQCAKQFKKVILEMGGKNPAVVFADASSDCIDSLVRAAFQNSGQICLCASRILIERSQYESFKQAFIAKVQSLRVGAPDLADATLGPMMSKTHFDKVLACIAQAEAEGGRVLCGGKPASTESGGWYIEATVIEGLPMSARSCQQEIFGPVVSLHAFDDEKEAIALANQSDYGLAASVWTSDLSRAHRLADALDCGIVWINTWMQRDLRTPFGGMKQSGFGREGGLDALKFFTEPKTICIGMP